MVEKMIILECRFKSLIVVSCKRTSLTLFATVQCSKVAIPCTLCVCVCGVCVCGGGGGGGGGAGAEVVSICLSYCYAYCHKFLW